MAEEEPYTKEIEDLILELDEVVQNGDPAYLSAQIRKKISQLLKNFSPTRQKELGVPLHLDILPQFSQLQQIENIESEVWSKSPERITRGYSSVYTRPTGKNGDFELRRQVLEEQQSRKRREIEERRRRYTEAVARRQESKDRRLREAKLNAERQRVESRHQVEKSMAYKEELIRKAHEHSFVHRQRLLFERELKASTLREKKIQQSHILQRRMSQKKHEINWRKKQFHQSLPFLDFINEIHDEKVSLASG